MSDIPRGRRRLEILAQQLDRTHPGFGYGARIHAIIDDCLIREPALRNGPKRASRVTARIRDAVKAFAAHNPSLLVREIGTLHGVDGGRVSEILNGKWDHL